MKSKTMLKFLLCFLIISALCISAFAYAAPSAQYFFGKGSPNTGIDIAPAKHVQSLIMLFGVFVAVIVVSAYGIQWVTATSARRQELKAGLYPLVIGVVLLVIGPKFVLSIYNTFSVTNGSLSSNVESIGGKIAGIVQAVGYVTATVMILVVAIQWLTSNPGKRQELKARMINIVIGAILIVGGVTILGLVAKFATDTKSSVKTSEIEMQKTHIACTVKYM